MCPAKSPIKNERGQVAILFALVFTFMFILFAFVVDFGHLINNKINLQIAADSAAYAGAAWQARILNHMGQVNYHLRQDLKELAMRVQVTHVRHNRNFPRGSGFANGGDQLPRGFYPFVCQQAHGYVANSGLRYASDTNLCRNASPEFGGLPPIVVPPVIASFDPFAVAIAAQIRQIQQKANQECRAAANDNRRLVEYLRSVYQTRSQFHVRQMRAMEEYLNQVAQESGNLGRDNPGKSPIVQSAVQSALRNLSFSNRNEFKLTINQPKTGEYIKLFDNVTNGSLFFYDFNVVGDGCVGKPSFLDGLQISTGLTKDTGTITYFSVKASSKPSLLFMPQAWVDAAFPELQAFATAKPFGSRLGPQANADQLVPIPNRPGNNNRMVNFSFRPNDKFGIMNAKIMAFLDGLHPFNTVGRPDGNQASGWPDPNPNKAENIRQPLQAIRAPTVFDSVFFTIFPDAGGNADADYLEPQFAQALYPDYLESAGPDNTNIDFGTPRTPAFFPGDVGSKNKGTGFVQLAADAQNQGGPYGGINYAQEEPASHSVTGVSNFQTLKGKEIEFGFANKELMHSGWAPNGEKGRIGYSVKFVGMDVLKRTEVVILQSGGQGQISNPPVGDPNLSKIYH